MKKIEIEKSAINGTLKSIKDLKSLSVGFVTDNDKAYVKKEHTGCYSLYVVKVRNTYTNGGVYIDLFRFGNQRDLNKFIKKIKTCLNY